MNLVYHTHTRNMGVTEKTQFDLKLAPPDLREKTVDRQNAEQMRLLMGGRHPGRMPQPLPHRRRKK